MRPLERSLQANAWKHPVLLLFKHPAAPRKQAALQTETVFAYMGQPMLQLHYPNYLTIVKNL